MPTLVQFDSPSGPILIEISGDSGVTAVTNTADGAIAKAQAHLRDSLRAVAELANEFTSMMANVEGCSSAELEFGLEVSGKGTVYVVETSAQAAFKIKLTFDLPAVKASA